MRISRQSPHQRVLVIGLSLAVALALAVPLRVTSRSADRNPQNTTAARHGSSSEREPFQVLVMSNGLALDVHGQPIKARDKEGRDVSVMLDGLTMLGPDGEKVYRTIGDFRSLRVLSDYVRGRLSDAKILERNPRLDGKGIGFGERILALKPMMVEIPKEGRGDSHETYALLIRTNGVICFEVYSKSLDDVLALEKIVDQARVSSKKP